MDTDLANLLIQSGATIIGGVILFLLGLLYSAISKRSKEYTSWLARNWHLPIGLLLVIYVCFNVFTISKTIYITLIPIVFSIAIILLVIHIIKSNEMKSSKITELQIKALCELKADIIMEEVRFWETEGVNENVLDGCSRALHYAPPSYEGYVTILDIVEKTIRSTYSKNGTISTYVLARLHKALENIPKSYAPLVDRIKKLLESNSN